MTKLGYASISLKFILLFGSLCLALTGCSSKEKEQCKDNVASFLDSYQQKDSSCGEYLLGDEEDSDVEFNGFQSILAEPIKYEINSVEINDDNNIVNVTVTNVDFGKVVEELVNDTSLTNSSDSILAELEKRLGSDGAPTKEFEVPIRLNKEYKIEMTSELSNALLGGYTEYIYELTEGAEQ